MAPSYCKSWKLKINMNKSKIMCLNETVNPNVHIDNEYLEHVTEYCYLGIVFTTILYNFIPPLITYIGKKKKNFKPPEWKWDKEQQDAFAV